VSAGILEDVTSAAASGRDRPLVVAANRLPVMRGPDGEWVPSPGGLVRALLPMLRRSGGIWAGWTGIVDDDSTPFTLDGVDLHPIPLSQAEFDDYYEGFANDSIWPLYHDAVRESSFKAQQWDSYVTVNERFANELAELAPEDAVIWIHDYHLQLVPAMVRHLRPDAVIGFFLHVPFPPWELFARLPWREELVDGLLGADLVGFQRTMGAVNFAAITQHVNAGETVTSEPSFDEPYGSLSLKTADGRLVKVGAFPISIDVAEFNDIAAQRAVRRASAALRSQLGNPEVVLLGVDRLDYTKGIGLRMRAFRSLLNDGTLDAERCVMIQVATPTREAVEHYRDERHEVERLVGDINGRHARIGQPVLHYLYRSLCIEDLVALYLVGDVMLVTPIRDGMNLVAKEYVASRRDVNGVLVLSEFAGAADQLTDAVLVNPHDEVAMRAAIVHAIDMHHAERTQRMAALRAGVARSDVRGWAERFLTSLTGDPAELPDGEQE
jgi:trehalose 6-phosphate synthase